VYVIVALPVVNGFRIPEVEPIEATAVFELLHVPPVTELARVAVVPVHVRPRPVMAGIDVTVTS
jgi:hypothetical protein